MESAAHTSVIRAPRRVTVENFRRAESHRHFASVVITQGAFGELIHHRQPSPIERQVVWSNRDTLYSGGVFDLNGGPVTISLPDAGNRFISMIAIDEDHYVSKVVYGGGDYTFGRDEIDTRYAMVGIRIFVDLSSPKDVAQVHALQDRIVVTRNTRGSFESQSWDRDSHKTTREALIVLGRTLSDFKNMFGSKWQVDPVRHLIGTAIRWGGNPERDVSYFCVRPAKNDGATAYGLTVKEAPIEAFWSISVYNEKGCFHPNSYNAYTVNSLTARKSLDGSITLQFGGQDENTSNYLPIMSGWYYIVRLYRPGPSILDGSWTFPQAQPVQQATRLDDLKSA